MLKQPFITLTKLNPIKFGAEFGIRTRDPNKLRYSYFRIIIENLIFFNINKYPNNCYPR